jgi:ankyrin repeat protein
LHLASGEGRTEIVELLCKEGANVNVEDRWGNRPLDDAVNAKKNSNNIVELLKKYGAKSAKNPALNQRNFNEGSAVTVSPAERRRSFRKGKEESYSGTIAYWAPELFSDNAVPTPSSDMWAAGVIMFVLLTGS